MSGYRLFIDIPLGPDQDAAIKHGQFIAQDWMRYAHERLGGVGDETVTINYRLGHDEDRQKSNYFLVNENGHVNNKKSSFSLGSYKVKGYVLTRDEE